MQILVNVDVDDLDRAVAFYTAAFELKLVRKLFDNSVAELVGAVSTIYLLQKLAGSSPSPNVSTIREFKRHWTPVHLDFVVNDLASAIVQASSAGAILEGEVQSFNWGKQATFADPFGHGFCLIEFQGKGYEAVA